MNKQTMTRAVAAGLLLSLAALSGCGLPPDGVDYSDKFAAANRKIAKSAVEFRKKVEPMKSNKSVQPQEVKQAYNDLVKTVEDVKSEVRSVRSPYPVFKESDELHAAYLKYLDGQEKLAKSDLSQVVKIVDDPNLDNKGKWTKIEATFKRVAAAESKDREEVKKALDAYASSYNIKIDAKR